MGTGLRVWLLTRSSGLSVGHRFESPNGVNRQLRQSISSSFRFNEGLVGGGTHCTEKGSAGRCLVCAPFPSCLQATFTCCSSFTSRWRTHPHTHFLCSASSSGAMAWTQQHTRQSVHAISTCNQYMRHPVNETGARSRDVRRLLSKHLKPPGVK